MPAIEGTGSVRRRGRGWEWYYDERPRGGRQKRRGGYATEDDAQLALALHRNRQERQDHFVAGTYTVASAAEAWLGQVQVKATTRERYERDVRVHIGPALGDRLLADLTPREVIDLFERLRSSGGRGSRNFQKPLSYSTLCGIYTVVRQLYQWALIRGLVAESPLGGLDATRVRRPRVSSTSPSDNRHALLTQSRPLQVCLTALSDRVV